MSFIGMNVLNQFIQAKPIHTVKFAWIANQKLENFLFQNSANHLKKIYVIEIRNTCQFWISVRVCTMSHVRWMRVFLWAYFGTYRFVSQNNIILFHIQNAISSIHKFDFLCILNFKFHFCCCMNILEPSKRFRHPII